MVSTMREREVFLLEPSKITGDPQSRQAEYGFILLVEDDTPTLRLERVILEEEGYTVEVVDNGEDAVKVVAEKSPVLILLDIGLPRMDGFDTCAQIRELSQVPVIMVTGRDCLEDKVKGMDVGADDYVTKPFLTHELATRVKVVLRRTGATAQEERDNLYLARLAQGPPAITDPVPEPAAPAAPAVQAQQPPAPSEPAPTELAMVEPVPEEPPIEKLAIENAPSDEPPIKEPIRPASETGIYEGTVRLTVSTLGPVRNLINFVSELRQSPQFRLLRLVANQHKEGMDIWLGLREPLEFVQILASMAGVHDVSPGSDSSQGEEEQLLIVTLD
ncbi:MAG: response regulator transcription factor [Chloroflexi bacterium]|nr:response regulator transcription factor [Chloroflexota bacterium]